MIAELALDLKAKIATVAGLESSTGLTIGGHTSDPAMLEAVPPVCWVQWRTMGIDLSGEHIYSPASGVISAQPMLSTFSAMLVIAYTSDADITDVAGLPLIDAVAAAVHGTIAESAVGSFQWRCLGGQLARVFNDRLAIELRFTVGHVLTPVT